MSVSRKFVPSPAPGINVPSKYRPADPVYPKVPPVYYSVPQYSMKSGGAQRALAKRYRKSSCKMPRRGFVNAEFKYVDNAYTTRALDTTGSIEHISIIPQGSTIGSRLGKSCRVTSVRVAGHLANSTAALTNHVQVCYVWDYQPNKALAALTDVFDGVAPHYQIKMENAERFKVLRTYDYTLTGVLGAPGSSVSFQHSFKVPNGLCMYTTADTSGVIGNCIEGALLVIHRGTTAAGTGAANSYLTHRVYFAEK